MFYVLDSLLNIKSKRIELKLYNSLSGALSLLVILSSKKNCYFSHTLEDLVFGFVVMLQEETFSAIFVIKQISSGGSNIL